MKFNNRNITQKFDFSARGFVHTKLLVDRSVCSSDDDNAWDNMVWIPILNLIFSSISLGLILK